MNVMMCDVLDEIRKNMQLKYILKYIKVYLVSCVKKRV